MAHLNESNPVEVDKYAASTNLHDAPVFVWWVPHVMKKHSRIIADVIKRHHKRTYEFGIQVP
jgi:hypothetical protein